MSLVTASVCSELTYLTSTDTCILIGSIHDCDISTLSSRSCDLFTGSTCVPIATNGGNYLMYPTISFQNQQNNRYFSPCSIQQITQVLQVVKLSLCGWMIWMLLLQAKGSCLHSLDPCKYDGGCCVNGTLLTQVWKPYLTIAIRVLSWNCREVCVDLVTYTTTVRHMPYVMASTPTVPATCPSLMVYPARFVMP